MVSYAQALFTGTPFDVPALEPLPLHYFSADAWKAAFKALQSHKAVPWFLRVGRGVEATGACCGSFARAVLSDCSL